MDASIAAIERNVVKEIMRECFPRKVRTNENFVHYLVRLLLLDPNWGVTDPFVTRDKVAKFVDSVIDKLANPKDVKLVILQMQFYFSCNLENLGNVPKKTRKDLSDRLSPLRNDIFETHLTCEDSIELFVKKIVSYIILISGLGNPKELSVLYEATAVFKSVMNEAELKEFCTYSREKKEHELAYLTKVVSGIRMYNKDCERGGYGIDELPLLLETAITSVRSDVQCSLLVIMEKVNVLTTVADNCYDLQEKVTGEGEYIMVCKLSSDIEQIYMENIKDLLVFYRQYELFIRQIIDRLDLLEARGVSLHNSFHEMLEKIHETLALKIAVPASIIFPLFEHLANIWISLQDQVLILTRYSEMIINLDVYANIVPFSKDLYQGFIENTMTDTERLEETDNIRLSTDNSLIKIFNIESSSTMADISTEFLGFCPWKLVETDGALIPGNPHMGVAHYNDRNYVFSIPEAFQGFSKKPKHYVRKVLDMARNRPHLITFLAIKEQLESVKDISVLAKVQVVLQRSENKRIQTADFDEITSTNIDLTYCWNIWDLKREALRLADVSRRKTVASQTIKTFSKNFIKSQTSGMRSRFQQTMTDNYTNVPTISNFIYGLRGRKDDKQFIIELTRPVKE